MSLNEKIKYYRIKKNMTQKELAKETGISLRSISNYEKGTRTPHLDAIIRISKALCVPLDTFVNVEALIDAICSETRLLIEKNNQENDAEDEDDDADYQKNTEEELICKLMESFNYFYYNDRYDLSILNDEDIEEIFNFLKTALELKLNEIQSKK